MSLTTQVRNYVLPNGIDLSNIRSKESLVITQNELSEVLRQLIQARNMITMGNSSAFMGMSYLDSSNNIINNLDTSNPDAAIEALEKILKDSQILRDRNINIASVLSSLGDFNFSDSIGDLLSGKANLLDSLKSGISGISNLADMATDELSDVLANIELESIPKAVKSTLGGFGSSVGGLDSSFNEIIFSLEPADITHRIGLTGKSLAEMVKIDANGTLLGGDISDTFSLDNIGGFIGDVANSALNQVAGPVNDFLTNSLGGVSDLISSGRSLFNGFASGDFSLSDIGSMVDSIKGIIRGVCEFILGMACCIEEYIKSLKDNNLDLDWAELLDTLGPLGEILKAIMKLLGFLLYLITMLIEAIKKIIDEIIKIIDLLVIECKDGYTECLCDTRI